MSTGRVTAPSGDRGCCGSPPAGQEQPPWDAGSQRGGRPRRQIY